MAKREQLNEDLPDYLQPAKILRTDGTVYTKSDGTEMTADEAADFIRASAIPKPEATPSPEQVEPVADQDSQRPIEPAQ